MLSCSVKSCVGQVSHIYSRLIYPLQDLDQEEDVPIKQVDYGSLEGYHKQELESKKEREEVKAQILYEQKGFCKEGGEGDGY